MSIPDLPPRALVIGPNAEVSAVLGMAFDEVHLATPADCAEQLAGVDAPWSCVVITGVSSRGGRLASLVADVLQHNPGPLDVLLDIREPYGADVATASEALRGLSVVDCVDLWGVPCIRLRRAASPDTVPDLTMAADGHRAAPAAPAEHTAIPAEINDAQIVRYERRIAELEEQVDLWKSRAPAASARSAAADAIGDLGSSTGSVEATARPARRRSPVRRVLRALRPGVAPPLPPQSPGEGPAAAKEVRALEATVRKRLDRQQASLVSVADSIDRLTERIGSAEVKIAVGAASATEAARRMATLPSSVASELGLVRGTAADADVLLFLADHVRGAVGRCAVVCDNGPLALWVGRAVRHHGTNAVVVAVESDPVSAAILRRAAAEDDLADLIDVRAPEGSFGQWYKDRPVPVAPMAPVEDVDAVGLLIAGTSTESGAAHLTQCPLRPDQLAAGAVVLLAGTWPPVRPDLAVGWADVVKGLRLLDGGPGSRWVALGSA